MKRLLFITSTLAAIILVSCQKEIDWGTGATGDQLLVMVRSMTGPDSSVVTYSYDGQRRLIGETTVGAQGGISLDMIFRVNRDASGIITSTVQKSPTLQAAGIDSLVTRYHYNSGTSKYTSLAFDLNVGGFAVADSGVYTYDANGRITNELHYLASGIIPAFAALENRYTYTGSGSNVLTMTQLAATNPGDPLDSVTTVNYLLDAKNNPLNIRNEGILLGRPGLYNMNNATKVDFVNLTDPTQNFTFDYTYKYNSSNKPDSAYQTRTPGGQVTASKYFYQ